jgi:hypothetical protein
MLGDRISQHTSLMLARLVQACGTRSSPPRSIRLRMEVNLMRRLAELLPETPAATLSYSRHYQKATYKQNGRVSRRALCRARISRRIRYWWI